MGTTGDKYVVDEYSFSTNSEYSRAVKEKETIAYLMSNTDMTDMKAVLKIYNRAVDKKSFQTVIGLEFIRNVRKQLIASGIVTGDTIRAVPVPRASVQSPSDKASGDVAKAQIERYKLAYENAVANRTIKNMVIIFLVIIIIAITVITYNSEYSIFTYFTDYKSEMENELIDRYESWDSELNKRENELNEREARLEERESVLDDGNE